MPWNATENNTTYNSGKCKKETLKSLLLRPKRKKLQKFLVKST